MIVHNETSQQESTDSSVRVLEAALEKAKSGSLAGVFIFGTVANGTEIYQSHPRHSTEALGQLRLAARLVEDRLLGK